MKLKLKIKSAHFGLMSGLLLLAVGTPSSDAALYVTNGGSGGVTKFSTPFVSSSALFYDPNEVELVWGYDYSTGGYGEVLRPVRHDPYGVAVDAGGNVFVADWKSRNIDKFTPGGVRSVVFNNGSIPIGLAFDSAGNLFASVGTKVRKFTSTGIDLGVFATAGTNPSGLAFDSAGNLYVSDRQTGTITKFGPGGGTGSVFGTATESQPGHWYGLAFDGAGNLYSASYNHSKILKFGPGGGVGVAFASLIRATGLTADRDGNLYATSFNAGTIVKFPSTGGVLSNVGTVIISGVSGANHLAFDQDYFPPSNTAPSASAGADQSIRAGDAVSLNGSESFDDNTHSTLLGYSWILSSPLGSTATLTDANTATPSFIADVAGSYVVELVVTDDQGAVSPPDSVNISSANQAPTSVATVDFGIAIVGTTSVFDGSGSTDPELDALTYSWAVTAAPVGSTATLVGATTASPTLTTDLEGTYEVTLAVSDFIGEGTPATVEVVATTPLNYAEMQIVSASDMVAALLPSQVTNKGNQTALGNFLKNATKNLQKGKIANAIADLNSALERTDGCALRGSPDGNGQGMDWITDCDAQADIYALLTAAVSALQ